MGDQSIEQVIEQWRRNDRKSDPTGTETTFWEPEVHTSIQVTLTGRVKQVHKNDRLFKEYHEAIWTEPATWWRRERHYKEWLPSNELHTYTTRIIE